jgi:hypothetical protein
MSASDESVKGHCEPETGAANNQSSSYDFDIPPQDGLETV